MEQFNFSNPVFNTFVMASAIMILKVVGLSWLTIIRMVKVNGGFRSPEDIRKTALNPNPSPEQLAPNAWVDRVRRVQLNDLENIPFFILAGFLFLFTEPSLLTMQILMYGYVVTRLAHMFVYLNEFTHDTRALFWTPGSLIIIWMTGRVLVMALN